MPTGYNLLTVPVGAIAAGVFYPYSLEYFLNAIEQCTFEN